MSSQTAYDVEINFYYHTISSLVRRPGPDLTARQLAIFLVCYHEEAQQTIRGLASLLNISRPAVTRALDRLESFSYVRRKTDTRDMRSKLVTKTPKGASFLREIDRIVTAFAAADGKAGAMRGENGIEALRRITTSSVASDSQDMSARQIGVIMTCLLTPKPHTIRGLAKTLNISKPAVTRAVDRLVELGYAERQRDPADGRSVFVKPTSSGNSFIKRTKRMAAPPATERSSKVDRAAA